MRPNFLGSLYLPGKLKRFKLCLNINNSHLIIPAYHRDSNPRKAELHVCDFYRHLPPDIPKENQKKAAQHVVDVLGHRGHYQFTFDRHYTLSEEAKGRLKCLGRANVYQFHCSQRGRPKYLSVFTFAKRRHRRRLVEIHNCMGEVLVIFPSTPCAFDFALEGSHPFHPGRPFLGTPKHIRKWIFDNPRPTPRRQREDLINAIAKGEIPGASERFIRASLVFYWWRKAYRDRHQPSDNPWKNMVQMLEAHQSVQPHTFCFPTVGTDIIETNSRLL
jgi:hypothetical protein